VSGRPPVTLGGASVLVTGGTRGIGLAIARRLVRDGAARVVLGYFRNDSAAESAASELRGSGVEVELVRGNVSSESTIRKLAAAGPYRVVVHNAATGVIRPALETEDKHWDWTLNANARSLLALARATAPQMSDGSAIVAISSLGSKRVLDNYVLVGTSKAALESVMRYLAVELAPRGIRVNAVSAGVVDTEALDHFPNKDEMLATAERTPAGRLVEPEDIAAAVSFLGSDDAAMVCGHTLVVDGGFSLPA
jgi:enoyl-[acyl-carrier protein] reductase III